MNHQQRRAALADLRRRAEAARASGAESRVVVTRSAADAATDGSGDGAAAPASSAELWLYGTVGGYWWGFDSDDVAKELRALGAVDHLLVRLHSFGGNAIEGVAIANLLANHPAGTTTVVVDGLAASAASLIALAGDELVMSPGAQLMIHDAWTVAAGNAAELRAEADWIDKQSQNYAETYAHRAGGTAAEWRDVMTANNGDGTWYSAEEAVTAGLADRVANIASTTPPPPIPDPADVVDVAPDLAASAAWDLDVLLHPAARAAFTERRRGALTPPSASAVGSLNTEGGSVVSFSDQAVSTLRTKLGVAGDADETVILAALDEALDERADEQPSASIPEGHVVIPAAKLATLEAGARAGADAAKRLHDRDREAFLDANRTKFPAGLRAAWAKQYDLDPAAAVAALAEAPDLIPAAEIGHELVPDAAADEGDDLYLSVFPEDRKGS
ncbi:hypothetical protein GCM10022215_18100 [Nocardioides fonticola]|uniref:ATP-dependent Clp protease proteolytic subunit n=1 Tax=Nocardioides fonticola TaxID=450363 RepID=A0ABP7XID8_9ACTN